MAKERVDASLDAFDALIAELADAGEISSTEVSALRAQQHVPHTSEIPLQAPSRWSIADSKSQRADASQKPEKPATDAAAPVTPARSVPPAQPRTRREARALREAQERLAAEAATAPAEAATAPASVAGVTAVSAESVSAESVAEPRAVPAAPVDVTAPVAPARIPAAPAPAAAEEAVEAAVEAENARRTADQIHSHRVRPAEEAEPVLPVAATVAAAPRKPRSIRRSLFAGLGAVVLIPSLWIVVPATADTTPGPATTDAQGRTAQQILKVGANVDASKVDNTNYVATAIAAIVTKEGGASAEAAAPAIVDALSLGGTRAQIIDTALSYIGTPYVFGGDSHTGIDCSGLTMEAYASVGINLAHYVPTQDAVGTRITQAEAQPGDLVVFDNEDHIGIYLGDNQVLAAPEPGRRVSIESVDIWQPVGIHFTRILPAGQ